MTAEKTSYKTSNPAVPALSSGTLLPKRRPQPWQQFRTIGDCRRALRWVFGQVKDKDLDLKTANSLTFIACSLMKAIELEDLESRIEKIESSQEGDLGDRSIHITVERRANET